MTKGINDDNQLTLDFTIVEKNQSIEQKAPIVQFVDSATRKLRAEAIHRVRTAGIFELSAGRKFR
jgi:hypothetical protein